MQDKIVILYVIENLGGGGKERRLLQVIEEISKLSCFDVHLLVYPGLIEHANTKLKNVSIHNIKYSLFNLPSIIRKINPTVVHTWSVRSSVLFSLLNVVFNFKLVSGFIGDTFRVPRHIYFVLLFTVYRNSYKVVSNSFMGLESYRVPSKLGKVVYNSFDLERIKKNNIKSAAHNLQRSSTYKVLMVANVHKFKDYDLFVDIAKKVKERSTNVEFISVGKIYHEYEDFAKVNSAHVEFLGFKSNVDSYISNCDIGLLCSEREGIPNSLIEMMAQGKVVITNAKGGVEELIEHQVDGFILGRDEIASKIIEILESPEKMESIRVAARNKIQSNFSVSTMLENYLDIYR